MRAAEGANLLFLLGITREESAPCNRLAERGDGAFDVGLQRCRWDPAYLRCLRNSRVTSADHAQGIVEIGFDGL
jgi:hypothetical protein